MALTAARERRFLVFLGGGDGGDRRDGVVGVSRGSGSGDVMVVVAVRFFCDVERFFKEEVVSSR